MSVPRLYQINCNCNAQRNLPGSIIPVPHIVVHYSTLAEVAIIHVVHAFLLCIAFRFNNQTVGCLEDRLGCFLVLGFKCYQVLEYWPACLGNCPTDYNRKVRYRRDGSTQDKLLQELLFALPIHRIPCVAKALNRPKTACRMCRSGSEDRLLYE